MSATETPVKNSASDAQLTNYPVECLIDGALRSSSSEATIDVTNPSNGKRLFSIPEGCDSDVNLAVAAARRAFDDGRWSDAQPSYRKKVLHAWADLIDAECCALDALDAEEMGKPIGEKFANAQTAASLMRFYAESVDKSNGDVYASDKGSFVGQRRVPRGVVAAIIPWNFPCVNAVRKLAPALAAGNCLVLKPSEYASRSAVRIASVALEAGLPIGVLNVVPGLGVTVGRALGLHTDIDMLTFTGSTQVGKKMLQYAGQSNLKVVLAECGGKSPQIVFDDGLDLDAVGESVAKSLLTNQGQICAVGSRLLVEESIGKDFVENIVARTFRNVVIGDALDPKTTFGPVVSERQCERVMEYIESASIDGAKLLIGGCRVAERPEGFFVEPTIFTDVPRTARIAQEEVFGPVLSVTPFRDEEDAIRIANGTAYGLMAYVWTTNLTRAMRLARAIRSSVRVNASLSLGEGAGASAAFEPAGLSGVGTETGLAGMESYMRRQLVWINHG